MRQSLCWTWRDPNNPKSGLDPKPLAQWALNYRLSKDGFITPEPFPEMDWEKVIFYTGLIEATDRAEEKQLADMKRQAEDAKHKGRR